MIRFYLRVRARIASVFRIPSAPHLRLELNRECSPRSRRRRDASREAVPANVARATPRILLNPSNQICGPYGRAKREVILARTLLVFLVIVFVAAPVLANESMDGRYVGAIVCKSCHGPGSGQTQTKIQNQTQDPFTVWSVSKHSRTWVQLGTGYVEMIDPDAEGLVPEGFGGSILKQAKLLGIDQNCLLCHATAEGVEDHFKAETFHPEDGVQCEACHGPGATHVAWMAEKRLGEERPKSVRMSIFTIDDCEKACHRPKPTHEPFIGADFNVEKAWKRIKH